MAQNYNMYLRFIYNKSIDLLNQKKGDIMKKIFNILLILSLLLVVVGCTQGVGEARRMRPLSQDAIPERYAPTTLESPSTIKSLPTPPIKKCACNDICSLTESQKTIIVCNNREYEAEVLVISETSQSTKLHKYCRRIPHHHQIYRHKKEHRSFCSATYNKTTATSTTKKV